MKLSWAAIRKLFTPETPQVVSSQFSVEMGSLVPSVVVPLDDGHKILGAFGITKPTPDYERWVSADGFALDDFQSLIVKGS